MDKGKETCSINPILYAISTISSTYFDTDNVDKFIEYYNIADKFIINILKIKFNSSDVDPVKFEDSDTVEHNKTNDEFLSAAEHFARKFASICTNIADNKFENLDSTESESIKNCETYKDASTNLNIHLCAIHAGYAKKFAYEYYQSINNCNAESSELKPRANKLYNDNINLFNTLIDLIETYCIIYREDYLDVMYEYNQKN